MNDLTDEELDDLTDEELDDLDEKWSIALGASDYANQAGGRSVFTEESVETVNEWVLEAGVVDRLSEWRAEDRYGTYRGGRHAIISDRAILVVSILLTRERRPLWIREMASVFHHRLSAKSLELLGVIPDPFVGLDDNRIAKNWVNNAGNALHRLVDTFDPYPAPRNKLMSNAEREHVRSLRDKNTSRRKKERADEFSNRMLEMTFKMIPRRIRRRNRKIDLAIDQTPVPAPSSKGRSKRDPRTGKEIKEKLVLELDAEWYHLNSEKRDTPDSTKTRDEQVWGYAANIATRVAHDPTKQAQQPLIAMSFTLSRPNEDVAGETVRCLQSVVDRGHSPGRVGGDKAYFANLKKEALHIPVQRQGWKVITDYKSTDLGIKGGKAGANQIEGDHYCPCMPEPLVNASLDAISNNPKVQIDKETYRKRIDERAKYSLRNNEKPDAQGNVPKMCPAYGAGATVECPIRGKSHPKASKKPKPTVLLLPEFDPSDPETLPTICKQSNVAFGPDDGIRHAQDFRYGSEEWDRTYTADRNTIESYNAHVKDPGYENLNASSRRRVRGFAAQQFMTTMLLVSANIRKILVFCRDDARREKAGIPLTTERPRGNRRRDREGLSNYKRQWAPPGSIGIQHEPPPDPPLRT